MTIKVIEIIESACIARELSEYSQFMRIEVQI